MSTTIDNKGDAENGEEKINLVPSITESSLDPSCSAIRCILNEESPDLSNPGLYNYPVCRKGFLHRSMNQHQKEADFTSDITEHNEGSLKNDGNTSNECSHIDSSHFDFEKSESILAGNTQ